MISPFFHLIVDHPCPRAAESRPFFPLENPRYGYWFVSWIKPLLSSRLDLIQSADWLSGENMTRAEADMAGQPSRAVTSGRYAKQIPIMSLDLARVLFFIILCSFCCLDTIHDDLEMWDRKGRFLLFDGRVTSATKYLYLYTYLLL